MGKELLLAVDLGTSFVKAGAYNLDSECVAIASEPVKDERPAPGIFIQHGEQLFESVVNCIKKVHDQIGERMQDIAGIAFTGQMAGFMGVGENWEDITGYSCSLDTRFTPYAERQMKELAGDFLEISGTNSPLFSTKYEWFKSEFPGEAKKIRKYLMLQSYITGKLGDADIEDATIDGSLLAWTGLADIKNRGWSEVICDKLDINRDCLPRVVESDEVVGHLSEKIAKVTGLKCGIPLVAGAGDKMAGCVGANILRKGDMIFEAGSYGGLSCLVDDFRPDTKSKLFDVLDGCFKGDLYAHHYIPGSGITLDWFMDTFGQGYGDDLGEAFVKIDEEVSKIAPGCNGLMAVGMLGGTAMPMNGDLKGVWIGHDWSHTKAHFYRSLLEDFSFTLTSVIRRINEEYPDANQDRVRIIGGGAKSKVWTQMLADCTGKSFERLNRDDVALWGSSILAASGVGLIDDIKKVASEHVQVKTVYTPNPEMTEIYKPLMERSIRLTEDMAKQFAAMKQY